MKLALVPGLDYPNTYRGFVEMFPDDNACAKFLAKLRWPEGFICPACKKSSTPWNESRGRLAAILKIYHELKLNEFFNNRARNQAFKYNTNSIMVLLVISRLLSLGSKSKAFEEKSRYFERFAFSLADIYRALSHLFNSSVNLSFHQ